MRAFLQSKDSEFSTPNIYNAYYGLKDFGIECIKFETLEDLQELYHSKNDLIVGGVGIVRKRLKHFDIDPPMIDYPEELKKYLGRNIIETNLLTVATHQHLWPMFVKSREQKVMTGKVISKPVDLAGLDDIEVYCSNVINFVSEYRVFVRYGQILDMKHYWGDPLVFPDSKIIISAIEDYTTAPDAYGIDFGVTDKGETLLIEVNDAWALGCYGLESHLYAKFLLTRWAQLVNIPDEYFYI